jgi:hypothetical protein
MFASSTAHHEAQVEHRPVTVAIIGKSDALQLGFHAGENLSRTGARHADSDAPLVPVTQSTISSSLVWPRLRMEHPDFRDAAPTLLAVPGANFNEIGTADDFVRWAFRMQRGCRCRPVLGEAQHHRPAFG